MPNHAFVTFKAIKVSRFVYIPLALIERPAIINTRSLNDISIGVLPVGGYFSCYEVLLRMSYNSNTACRVIRDRWWLQKYHPIFIL